MNLRIKYNILGVLLISMLFSAVLIGQELSPKEQMDQDGAMVPNPENATPNDDCANAEEILEFGSIFVDITDNSYDPTDPLFSCHFAGPTSTFYDQTTWYTFTPGSDGLITISSCNSGFDGLLGIYTGSCGAFTEVACSEDECGFEPEIVDFAVTAGTTYHVMYAEYGFPFSRVVQLDVSGTFSFNAVPTLGEWGLIILGLSLVIFGIVAVRQRQVAIA